MKQALHIFKKDVRGLTYEVVVMLLLIAAFAAVNSSPYATQLNTLANWWSGILKVFLVLSWWLLAARVVHADAIPGDRQFWLTRPYSWKSLLAAKVVFLVTLICIPMAISDAIVLHAQGFPVVSNAGGILWELLLRFNWILLVCMVVAGLTRGLGSFAILSLVAAIAILYSAGFQVAHSYWQLDWVIFAMGIGLIPAILFQYARRKKIAIVLTLCAWLLPMAGVNLELRLRPPIKSEPDPTSGPDLQFLLDPHPTRIFFPRSELKPFRIPVVLPIEILGIPQGLEMRSRTVGVTLWSAADKDAPNNKWMGGLGSNDAVLSPDRSFPNPRFFWLEIMVPKEVFDRATEQKAAVRVHVWAEITLYRNLASTLIGKGEFAVPGLGFCQSANGNALACRTALRHPSVEVTGYDIAGYRGATTEFTKRPFPAELGINPIVDFFLRINSRDAELITGDPVYRLQRTFDLSPVHLEDYAELRAK